MNATPPRRLHDLLAAQAALRPDAPALWWRQHVTSYGDLQRQVEHLSGRLAATGATGERVAILAWNCPEFIHLIYACAASGRVLVPLNARLAPAELCYQLRSAGVSMLFGDPALLEPLLRHADYPKPVVSVALDEHYHSWLDRGPTRPLPATASEDAVWILYTSGSTGRPKGAIITHRSFVAGLASAAIGRPVQAGDRYYYPFPLFHIAAHNVLLQHLYGACVVLSRAFDADDALRTCRDVGITTLSLAPTMIGMLLQHPEFNPAELSGIRAIGYGASAMPQTLLRQLLSQLDVDLCQSYGMTELSGSVAFLTPQDHRRAVNEAPHLLKSVGRPLPTAEVRIVDDGGRVLPCGEDGEIIVRAGQTMQGYWQDPGNTALALRDGWLHTGDVGRLDEYGYLFIVDRKKDMIVSGGENIASREVEEILRRHPKVADCAVIGLPDDKWGECVCAVITEQAASSDEELETHCRSLLAGYKTPRRWLRVAQLPVNAGGKVDKPRLRQQMSQATTAGTPKK